MIGLRIGDEFLDLPEGPRLTLRLNNPIFNADNLSPGSFSFPFDVDAGEKSQKNSRLLGHPDVIESYGSRVKIDDVNLYVDLENGGGVRYKKGTLNLSRGDGDKISTNFTFGLSTISDELRTKKLRDIINTQRTISTANRPKRVIIEPINAAAAVFRIEVQGEVWEAANLAALAAAINGSQRADKAIATYVAAGPVTPRGLTAPYIVITPSVGLNDPLSPLSVKRLTSLEVNDGNGWYVDADLPAAYWQDFRDYVPPAHIRFPVFYNDNIYGEAANPDEFGQYNFTKVQPLVNFSDNLGLIANVPRFLGKVPTNTRIPFQTITSRGFYTNGNFNSRQPFIHITYVLDKIGEYFGFTYEGDWLTQPDVQNMLVYNASPLDVVQDYVDAPFTFWKRSYNEADLVPDISVLEFFKALQSRYNLAVYLNEDTGRVVIKKREVMARNATPWQDVTPMAGRVQGREDLRITGVRLVCPPDNEDRTSFEDSFIVGTGEQAQPVTLGALQQTDARYSVPGPKVTQKAGSKFAFRVFYWKGNGLAGLHGDDTIETLDNLYQTHWKYWLHYQIRRRGITLPVSLPFRLLKVLPWDQKVAFDRKQFAIKSLEVELTHHAVRVTSVELYTMM